MVLLEAAQIILWAEAAAAADSVRTKHEKNVLPCSLFNRFFAGLRSNSRPTPSMTETGDTHEAPRSQLVPPLTIIA
jgi:hypothetical protein